VKYLLLQAGALTYLYQSKTWEAARAISTVSFSCIHRILLITSTSNFSTNGFIVFVISDCLGSPAGLSTNWQIHDKILPKKIHADLGIIPANSEFVSPKKATSKEIEFLQHAVLALEEKENYQR
jgi:hypothetical protein